MTEVVVTPVSAAPAPLSAPPAPAGPARRAGAPDHGPRTTGSSGVLVRTSASTALATRAAGPHARLWQLALTVLGVVVLLTVCGLGSYLIVADERQGADASAAGASPVPTVVPRDVSNRTVDAAPLTAKEVFPQSKILITGTPQAYQVLRTQAVKDCRIAAENELRKLLVSLKCNQVVRATLRSPTKEYLVTGGVLNLETAAGAQEAKEKVQSLVDRNKGRFLGYVTGDGTEPLALASTHVGWDSFGHYLVYCVIARADGRDFADNDPYARQILYDVVELHLRNTVLEKRATAPASPAATGG